MATPPDDKQRVRAARDLLATRIKPVERLGVAEAAAATARATLADAEHEVTAAWVDAVDAGWSPDELTSIGFTPPTDAPARTRPTKTRAPRRTNGQNTETATQGAAPSTSEPSSASA